MLLDCGQSYSATNPKVQASLPTRGRICCSAIQGSWSFFCSRKYDIRGNESASLNRRTLICPKLYSKVPN
jgi:hypothetical protein